ncbi:SRPBCC family protein [Nakamurella antarctica]|uniref:SRPBCC family protein n=1 Tax=Nakamurella antarctica TaxID=1902245 RepID=A0A3G8ZQD6_9ACTN|nr:SRPBCC family protein [Nakamurella antarctica]
MRLTITARGTASSAVVWERYAQPALWPEWSPLIQSVQCSHRRLQTGSTGTVRGPANIGIDFVIVNFDETNLSWVWDVKVPVVGSTLRLDHFVGDDNGATSTSLTINGCAPYVVGYAPLAKLALNKLVAGQA